MSLDQPLAGPAAAAPDFQRLYEEAPCGWFVMHLDGTVVHANAMMRALAAREDLAGAAFPDLLTAGGRIYYQTHCVPMLRITGGVREIALEMQRDEGPPIPVLLNALLAGDDVVHATLFDASDRRSYERELLSARRNAERASELLKEAQADLRHAASHDALTGLPNRRRMTTLLERCLQDDEPVTVFFIDLDRFKPVNDSLGHEAGDALLRSIAERLRDLVGEGAILGRWGGDEFLLILPGTDVAAAEGVARNVLQAVGTPVDVGRMTVEIGASIGISRSADRSASADALVREADEAMYRAKERGSNCYQFTDGAPPALVQDTVTLLDELRAGLARDEFRLHYQPRVDLRSGAVTGVEALVRWQHPTRGLLGPAQFIDVAERSGAVTPLGDWVMRTAVRQAATWNVRRRLDVAVNLSASEMCDPKLPARVLAMTQQCGLPPSRLTLELKETALLADPEVALRNARALRESGIRLALDDFGIGYSGFTYLKRLPVDELKIDRTFVAGMHEHSSDRAIVRGTIALAHELRLAVVAEGVETSAQDALLSELGCDLAQGYLYLKAKPAEEVEPFLPSARVRHPFSDAKAREQAPARRGTAC